MTVDHLALLPGYAAAGTALLVLVLDIVTGRRAVVAAGLAGGTVVTALAALVPGSARTFCAAPGACSWVSSPRATVATIVFALLTLAVAALSGPLLRRGLAPVGEHAFLLACAMTGGVVVGYAGDLITLIVGLETLTLPLYVLVGLRRPATSAGAQASVTFFVVSVVSTAVALLGAGLVYAASGALHLQHLDLAGAVVPLARVGVTVLLAGIAFKVAAVPLHAWAPVTYDGAPLPIAAYLSTASKLGGVVALVALTTVIAPASWTGPVLAVLAVATMTVGNLVALRQRRMVRLLAWSSIAQAGYILAPLAVHDGTSSLAYASFFVLLELLAFAVVVAFRRPGTSGGDLTAYRGAARRSPWLGAALVVALTGLAGLPPGLVGLFAKVAVIRSLTDGDATWLAIVVAVNAVIALAYYVRVAAVLYAAPTEAAVVTDAAPGTTPVSPAPTVSPAPSVSPAPTVSPASTGEIRPPTALTPASPAPAGLTMGGPAGASAGVEGAAPDGPPAASGAPSAGTVTTGSPTATAVADPLLDFPEDDFPAASSPPAEVVVAAVTVTVTVTLLLGFLPQLLFTAIGR